MTIEQTLIELEEQFWTGGPEFYHSSSDAHCLVAFPGMARVLSADELAGTVASGPRWRDLEIEVKGLIQPLDDVAILTYEASALRGEDERYRALVSSAYVKRDDSWKLAFHQQTPLTP